MVTKVIMHEADIEGSCLTDKQVEVLQFVCDRRTNKEIALMLGISPSAVEQRLQSVRRKFGVHSRADLARAYEKTQGACANLTGVEYQVEQSIPDGQSPTKYYEKGEVHPKVSSEDVLPEKVEFSAGNINHEAKSSVLEVVDRTAGMAGRIAAITTAAASIALLIILVAEVAPALKY